MPRYKIKTTVDITRSNPSREDTNSVRNGQQLNFNTLLQGIGMRANVEWDNDPQLVEYQDTKEWFWEFEAEQIDVFATKDDSVGLLKQDLQGIPVIRNLTETVALEKPIFITGGDNQNIWIKTA
jgi:hypothetical protein